MATKSCLVMGLRGAYLILFRVVCYSLQVANQKLQGMIIVIWEVVDLEKISVKIQLSEDKLLIKIKVGRDIEYKDTFTHVNI